MAIPDFLSFAYSSMLFCCFLLIFTSSALFLGTKLLIAIGAIIFFAFYWILIIVIGMIYFVT